VIEIGAYTLRPWQPADTSFVFHCCQDPDIQRWTTVPVPYRPGDAASFVVAHATPQPEDASAWFAVVRTDTGELLGSISLNWFDRRSRTGEMGYWLGPDARGQGVMSTVLAGLARWAVAALDLASVMLRIAAGNSASRRVAARAGFVERVVERGASKDGQGVDDSVIYAWEPGAAPSGK
jgi:RimJ/RimL family protein N-acetyltransferase